MNLKIKYFLPGLAALCLISCPGCGKKESDGEKLARAANQIRNGDLKQSQKLVSEVLNNAPDNPSAGILQALIYEKEGKLAEAVDVARQVAMAQPESFTAQYTFGRLSFLAAPARSDYFAVLENAHRLNPDDVNTIILLCNVGSRSGKPQVLKYLTSLQRNPKFASSATLCYQFATSYAARRDTVRALAFFKMAVAKSRGNAAIIYNVAAFIDRANLAPATALNYYKLFLKCPNRNRFWEARAKERIARLNTPQRKRSK